MKRKRFFSLIFVPDQDKDPKSISLSYGQGKLLLFLLAILAVHAMLGAFGYYRILRLEALKRTLLSENEDYKARNKRIDQIAREVNSMRVTEEKIRKAFGATLGVGSQPDAKAEAGQKEPSGTASTQARAEETAASSPGTVYFLTKRKTGDFDPEFLPTLLPVEGALTTHFRNSGIPPGRNHRGIDIAAQKGTPIRAAASGVVIMADWTPDLGNLVIVSHGMGFFTHYGHNLDVLVEQGSVVKKGQTIALVGSSGISSAPHLHFELWKDAKPIDPEQFLYAVQKLKPGSSE
jgi:murein DD-endopeptidase MepM/ murein hydrolase activator NlpD